MASETCCNGLNTHSPHHMIYAMNDRASQVIWVPEGICYHVYYTAVNNVFNQHTFYAHAYHTFVYLNKSRSVIPQVPKANFLTSYAKLTVRMQL